MTKEKIMQQLNFSYKECGLTCSFNDDQLSEFIQRRRCRWKVAGKEGSRICRPTIRWDLDSRSSSLFDPSEYKYAWIGNIM